MRNTTRTRRSTNGPLATAARGRLVSDTLMEKEVARFYLEARDRLIVSGKFTRSDFKPIETFMEAKYRRGAEQWRSIAHDQSVSGTPQRQQRRRRAVAELTAE